MPKSQTHNEIVLRPPPGTRFTIFGSDVHLEFQRGREREVINWLRHWIDAYIEPEARAAEAAIGPNPVPNFFPKPPIMVQPQPQQQSTPLWPTCLNCGQIYNSVINTRCTNGKFCTNTKEVPEGVIEYDGNPQKITAEEIIAQVKPKSKLPLNLDNIRKVADTEFEKLEQQSKTDNNNETKGNENHG